MTYSATRQFDFVSLDDPEDVAANPHVFAGLAAGGVEWAMTSGEYSNWFPLTRLSHLVDSQLFAMRSGSHHIVNVIFHSLATLALFAFLFRATRERWPSVFVAFMFALHPFHVESVAWVAERKDVLCGFFWFATLWAYVRYAERPEPRRYLLALAFFILGLMSKPMIVTLPLILLLVDVWPLQRWTPWPLARRERGPDAAPIRWTQAVREKIPFLALSAASCVITYFVQKSSGAVMEFTVYPAALRFENAAVSYLIYLYKTVWPTALAVFYPYRHDLRFWQAALAGAALLSISALVLFCIRRWPYLAVGWFWFLGSLVPVVGLVQVGDQARADRYMYLPMTGLAIMVAWSVADATRRFPRLKPAVAVLATAAVVWWAVLTSEQIQYWRNSIVLYEHALDVTGENSRVDYFLGSDLIRIPGRLTEGIAHLEAALRTKPDYANAHTNLAGALSQVPGGLPRALEHYEAAARLRPNSADVQYNLGVTLARIGRYPEAINHLEEALRLNPSDQSTAQALRQVQAARP